MNLLLNISEIAIITGDNQYKKKGEYLISVWQKNHKEDYKNFKNKTNFVKENDLDIIKKISNKNNLDISKEIQIASKSNNTKDLKNLKKKILDKIEKLPEIDKKEITKSITNVTNTNFGIKNEDDITKIYERMTGSTIIKDDKFHTKHVITIDEFDLNIHLGGKIDGINEKNGHIIEVKNRIYKLFYHLRSYEKVQIMSYMYIFGSSNAHLVEAFRKIDDTEINIIEISYDEEYMNRILNKINNFGIFYYKFLNDEQQKINLLNNSDSFTF